MTCLTCAHMNLQAAPQMSKVGFGHCKFDSLGVFKSLSFNRDCRQYAAAKEEIAAKREAWAAQQHARGESHGE